MWPFTKKEPKPEVAWHIEAVRGHWNEKEWKWDERSLPYLLVSCWATKADAERDKSWLSMSPHWVSLTITGPHNHAKGTCGKACLTQEQKYRTDRDVAIAARRAAHIVEQQAGDWVSAIGGRTSL